MNAGIRSVWPGYTRVGGRFALREDGVLTHARRILALAAERHLRFEEERAGFPRASMRSIERSTRNARGS